MVEWYLVSSLLVMALAVACMRFFWPLVRGMKGSFEGYMVRSVVWMGGTMFARTFYWDFLQGVLPRAGWVQVRDALGFQEISVLFNVGFIIALFYALQGARQLIPEGERRDWPWWKIWTYPQGPCIAVWKDRRKK